jgi:hypothetical protein
MHWNFSRDCQLSLQICTLQWPVYQIYGKVGFVDFKNCRANPSEEISERINHFGLKITKNCTLKVSFGTVEQTAKKSHIITTQRVGGMM